MNQKEPGISLVVCHINNLKNNKNVHNNNKSRKNSRRRS